MSRLFTSLPRHLYCYVERRFIAVDRADPGLEPCTWFGLTSVPGRAWGLTVLLECGAIYSHVPPHAIVFGSEDQTPEQVRNVAWPIGASQLWDCFGYDFAVHEYEHLAGRDVEVWVGNPSEVYAGSYLFTAQHYGDGYSRAPEQAKQYHFVELEVGRLTCVPANRMVVHAPEFTGKILGLPPWLRRQTEVYSCEGLAESGPLPSSEAPLQPLADPPLVRSRRPPGGQLT